MLTFKDSVPLRSQSWDLIKRMAKRTRVKSLAKVDKKENISVITDNKFDSIRTSVSAIKSILAFPIQPNLNRRDKKRVSASLKPSPTLQMVTLNAMIGNGYMATNNCIEVDRQQHLF